MQSIRVLFRSRDYSLDELSDTLRRLLDLMFLATLPESLSQQVNLRAEFTTAAAAGTGMQRRMRLALRLLGLYATKRGERPLIGVAGAACQSTDADAPIGESVTSPATATSHVGARPSVRPLECAGSTWTALWRSYSA